MSLRFFIYYIFVFLLSFLFALIIFEIYARINSEKFLSYGWQNNNIIEDKIKDCTENKKLAIFGDSFVEYFGDSPINLGKLIEKKSKYQVCNFGLSGTRISDYINRFLFVNKSNLTFEKIIFFIYEGNDFNEFRYFKDTSEINNLKIDNRYISKYNAAFVKDRRLKLLKNLVKTSYSLNFIYRELYKKNFVTTSINETFVEDVFQKNLYKEIVLNEALKKLNSTPISTKQKLSSGLYNVSWYELALRNPNYFNDIFKPSQKNFENQKIIATNHINFINKTCNEKSLDCSIIIIPADFNNFESRKKMYEEIFQFNYNNFSGKPFITNYLLDNYNNVYYPYKILSENDYLENDIHLNKNGNVKLAEFAINILKNNN